MAAAPRHLAPLLAVTLVCLAVSVAGDCRLGVLKPVAGAQWNIYEAYEVFSIVPDIIKPVNERHKSTRAPRPSEAAIFVETQPPLPPSTRTRLCIRSLPATCSSNAAAAVPGASPPPTDPDSFIFNATEGFPYGPCLELSADDTAASLSAQHPHPDSCWPGGNYCTDFGTEWKFTRSPRSSPGRALFDLNIVRSWSTYQDTDGSMGSLTTNITFQLTDGCALKVHASSATTDPATSSCLSCSGPGQATLGNIASSSTCSRCPSRSSKAGTSGSSSSSKPAAVSSRMVDGNAWQCIPGMPKGFESIAIRMGVGGNPECASLNGKNCLRNLSTATTCQAMLPLLAQLPVSGAAARSSNGRSVVQALQPLTCGAYHKSQWGISGYDTPGHWCSASREWLQDRQGGARSKCVAKP